MQTVKNNASTGVSLQSFLQIIEMDKVTATVSIKKDGQRKGSLFFADGLLVDAEYENKCGLDAAYILCVQKFVSFSIEPPVERPVRIDVPLSHVLLQASLIHDEQQKTCEKEKKISEPRQISLQELVNFFEKTERVIHYILLNRRGNIIAQAGHNGKNRSDKDGVSTVDKFTPFLMSCAFSMINVGEHSGSSLKRCVVVLEGGRVSISNWYKNMVLSVLLTNMGDIRKMEVLLDRLDNGC